MTLNMPPFRKFYKAFMSGVSLQTCLPNLESIALFEYYGFIKI